MGVFIGMITDRICTIIHGMVLNYVHRLILFSYCDFSWDIVWSVDVVSNSR